jgi:hypothetical protein
MRSFMILLAAVLLSGACLGQTPEAIVAWSAHAPAAAVAGSHLDVRLHARIEDGWHIYSISQPPGGPTTTYISLTGKLLHQNGVIQGPEPQRSFDPNFGIETQTHEGQVSYVIPAMVDRAAPAGEQKAGVDVTFQSCNDTLCLPPHTTHLEIQVKISRPHTKAAPHP